MYQFVISSSVINCWTLCTHSNVCWKRGPFCCVYEYDFILFGG